MRKRRSRDRRQGVGRVIVAVVIAGLPFAAAHSQFGPSNQFTLSEAQLDRVDSAIEGELAAIEALLEDEHWDEAVERLRALAERDDGRVVLVDSDAGLFISLREHCQRLICRLPEPALNLYRDRVDGLAEGWYRQAIAERDAALLERIVQQVFASSYGDDALDALGQLALERADYTGARRAWERISPLLRDPEGRPLWIALKDVDVRANWDAVEPIWMDREGPPNGLFYPDTDLVIAEVLARLVLVSIREEAFDRAETELAVLEGLFPEAEGWLGGKNVVLADALHKLLAEARMWPSKPADSDWATFAGAPDRNGRAEGVPAVTNHVVWRVSIAEKNEHRPARNRSRVVPRRLTNAGGGDPLNVHPIVVGDYLLYNDRNRVYSLDLARGESAVTGRADGVLYAPEREPSRAAFQPGRGRLGAPRFTLTATGGTVFARTGSPLTTRAEGSRLTGDEGLVGLEVAGGRLQMKVAPPDDRWAFEGAPLVDGDRVLVAARQSDVRPRALVACFSRTTGDLLWQTFVASADTPARPGWEEVSHHLLTLAGDTVYYSTSLGVIAALDARDGQIRWIKRYDRAAQGDLSQLAPHYDRTLTPCVYDRGVLYCAPSDTPFLFGLDAVTGQTLWASDLAEDAIHLLGVANNRLIASGNRLWWFDAVNGKVLARWPEGPGSGLHGHGRGILAGDAVLWPTREQQIFVFDISTAEQRRASIDLRPLDVHAGNLLVAGDYLVIAGTEEIVAVGPPPEDGQDDPAGVEVALLRRIKRDAATIAKIRRRE